MSQKLSSREILDAANSYYNDGYVDLEAYYDEKGNRKKGRGDLLGEWVVNEIKDAMEESREAGESEEDTVERAIHRLETGADDMSRALRGLAELHDDIRRAKAEARPRGR